MDNDIRYLVVVGHTINDLIKSVNELIDSGYEPMGGVNSFTTANNGCVIHTQAIYKK